MKLQYKQRYQHAVTYITAGLLAIGLMVSPSWFANPAAAQSSMDAGTITVVGEGEVTIEPDIARANIGVEVSGSTVAEASAESRALIQAILTVLEEQGIDPKDIQTSNFNIYAERYGSEGPLADDEIQYRVNNMVSVVIRDLDRVGAILDAAIEAGANSINGISFQVEDPSSVESDARQSAVEDARAKAEELASLTGVGIGSVISISEIVDSGGGLYRGNFDAVSNAMGGGGDGFSPGELSLVMRLQVSYRIAADSTGGNDNDSGQSAEENGQTITMFVSPETADCVGVGPQTCLQVKYSPDEEWTLFYDEIDGFEYEPGFGYELLVEITEVENPPADASSLQYRLVELVAKHDVSEEAPASALDGTAWTLTGLLQDGTMVTDEFNESVTASFEDGTMFGVSACNNYSTNYSVDGDSIELALVVSTMMACPEETMALENAYLLALESVEGYSVTEDTLELSDADGTVLLTFTAASADSDDA